MSQICRRWVVPHAMFFGERPPPSIEYFRAISTEIAPKHLNTAIEHDAKAGSRVFRGRNQKMTAICTSSANLEIGPYNHIVIVVSASRALL